MSYLVLARKWRPTVFEDVVGQEHVTRTLRNAIEQDRVAHALLFTGSRGVGKTSCARILAKALNCANGPTPEPCGVCPACDEVTRGTSVDVLEIDGASNNSVEQIREIRESVKFLPNRGKRKVYIIDEVHMLTTAAFNALLKTLEEPPAHVLFVFATTEPHKIPETILSRCQRFDFKRIAERKMVDALARIAESEGLHVEPAALHHIAREANGGMRDSLSLLDQIIAFCGKEISEAATREILGIADRQLLHDLTAALLNGDASGALERIDALFRFGIDLQRFATDLVQHLRDLLVIKVSRDPAHMVDLPLSEIEAMAALVADTPPPALHRIFDALIRGAEEVSRSAFPKLVLEMTLLRICTQGPTLPLTEVLAGLARLEGRLPAGEPGGDGPAGQGGAPGGQGGPRTGSAQVAGGAARPPVSAPPSGVSADRAALSAETSRPLAAITTGDDLSAVAVSPARTTDDAAAPPPIRARATSNDDARPAPSAAALNAATSPALNAATSPAANAAPSPAPAAIVLPHASDWPASVPWPEAPGPVGGVPPDTGRAPEPNQIRQTSPAAESAPDAPPPDDPARAATPDPAPLPVPVPGQDVARVKAPIDAVPASPPAPAGRAAPAQVESSADEVHAVAGPISLDPSDPVAGLIALLDRLAVLDEFAASECAYGLYPLTVTDAAIEVAVPRGEAEDLGAAVASLERVARLVLNDGVRFQLIPCGDGDARLSGETASDRRKRNALAHQEARREAARQDPVVLAALRALGARIVEINPR